MNLEFNYIGPEGAQAWPVSDVLGPIDSTHIKGYPKYYDVLWVDVACLISVWPFVICPGIASLVWFHSKHFQMSDMSIRRLV